MGNPRHFAGVLVVEDDVLVAMHNKAVLNELGIHNVYVAHNMRAGKALLSSIAPDLGILDVNIGSDLVFPLAAELREQHVPILFLSGRAPSELPVEWRSNPILSKPLTKKMLAVALAGLGFDLSSANSLQGSRQRSCFMG